MDRKTFVQKVTSLGVAAAVPAWLKMWPFGMTSILGTACAPKTASTGERVSEKPNIIFILADDMGYGDLGCYGQETVKTPNLDAMAAEGMRFTQVYAGSTVCAPSRSCLLTGQHTGHTTVRANFTADARRVSLRAEDVTFAEVVKLAGYVTGIFGKWHIARRDTEGIPNEQGFDEHFGKLASKRDPVTKIKSNEPFLLNGEIIDLADDEYPQQVYTEKALDFIKRHRERPFMLYMPYNLAHAGSGNLADRKTHIPIDPHYVDEDWPEVQKRHATQITALDRYIGQILNNLKELGLDSNTLVIFTSDNGPHREDDVDPDFFNSNGPLRGIKRDIYEGGIRVPTIARWPGKIEARSVSDHIWSFWDVLPTMAELTGTPTPPGIDGLSVVPAFFGEPAQEHDYLYWEVHQGGFRQAIRKGDWKAVRFTAKGEPTELYNLRDDLGEQNNVADQHPTIIKMMEELFIQARRPSKNYPALIDEWRVGS